MQRCAGEICYTNVWCAPHCKNALSFLEAKIKELLFTVYKTVKRSSFLLCHSKNKPPAMQGEGRSLDISMSSCAIIEVGLQNHK